MLFWLGMLLAFDIYTFQAVRTLTKHISPEARRGVYIFYWSFTVLSLVAVLFVTRFYTNPDWAVARAYAAGFFMANLIFKLVAALFMTADDLRRFLFVLARLVGKATGSETLTGLPLSRSEFMAKAALLVAAVPAVGMLYGVARGGHRYQVRKTRLPLAKLPAAFEGLKIVHISDIHSGSFFSRAGVQKGVDLIMAQKPDVIFFTGDLVNNAATEIEPFIEIFKQVTAPMGVFSTLGNHDYGDYVIWETPEAKTSNLRRLMDNHARLGWDLLMDEHRWLERGGERIALLGVQNWAGRGNFPKKGNLAKAYAGTEASPVKILLSHDPSHWRVQVTEQYKDIDLMLAGHTHGMQFGIESKFFRWSPVQYVYEQWAGLYTHASQHLYVNRGFGFIGYPGRFGIWPEITVIELVRG